ncbi:hypothetical protein Glove_139g53 [Diversispora epigaea]|uniref:Uncharacterized protein n=1 Tax=Diversispora epigaea TaxID=1348612 RepID=A0A397IZF7_9GLOM|nr:hypothetical protein Glove_139g53 [Diversispora epigaea]
MRKHLSVFIKELNSEYQSRPTTESSEECAIQLHHYTPQDEIDKGMFCLFANKKSNPKEPFEALRENNLNNNKNNSNEFQWIYPRDKCLLDKRNHLKMISSSKKAILREIMRAIIQKAIEDILQLVDLWIPQYDRDEFLKAYKKVIQLVDLWIPQYDRDEFLKAYKKVIESAGEVYELLSHEVSRL